MDIISHGLYGGVAFGRKSTKDYIIAFFFGIAPDLFSFGLFFLAMVAGVSARAGRMGPPDPSTIPAYVHMMYDYTHSFVVYAVFLAILLALGKRALSWLTLGWPLHILVDIPTHGHAFFPTPFLWPLSSYSVDGVPWSNPVIFVPNVIILVTMYSYWFWNRKRRTS